MFAQNKNAADSLRIASCRPGFDGVFKTGYWIPATIELEGGAPGSTVEVELLAPDDDGVMTAVRMSTTFDDAGRSTVRLTTKIGRIDAMLTVNLRVDDEVVRSRNFVAGETAGPSAMSPGLPANTELVLHVGTAEVDLSDALRVQNPDAPFAMREVVRVADLAELPTDWFGYDSVNWLVVSTSDLALFDDLHPNHPQLAAIAEWVEMGGRLLMLCGQNAPQLIAAGQSLAPLVPGELEEVITLDTLLAIEQYSASNSSVMRPGESVALSVPRLGNVTGRIEAAEGNLPLVVRSPRGFGEIVFAGVDLDKAPLKEWNDRAKFVRRLLRVDDPASDARVVASRTITTRGYEDLAGALRSRLGSGFAGVSVVPFGLITVLVLVYLTLIGPVDYFLVKRLGRMEWTWITFPAIIVLVSCGAYAFAHAQKGGQQRLNQAELVDVDLATGRARGNVWACLYSPAATTYDVSLVPRWPDGTAVDSPEVLLSWFGMPGKGLGGMSARSELPTVNTASYRNQDDLSKLEGLPIETWSTKSLAARWTASAPQLVTADLAATDDALLEGTVRNDTGTELTDVRLLYGTWGWRLGHLPPGKTFTVDRRIDPLKVRTLLTGSLRDAGRSASTGRGVFVPEQAEIDELLDVITFYDATGGRRFSRLSNQYHAQCDLTHLLDLGQAVLMARCDRAGSELVGGNQPLGGETQPRWTLYRFVIPVAEER